MCSVFCLRERDRDRRVSHIDGKTDIEKRQTDRKTDRETGK